MLMMQIAGTIYLFPAWATALRSQLHYTTEQSNLVGTLLNLGKLLNGFFHTSHMYLPSRGVAYRHRRAIL